MQTEVNTVPEGYLLLSGGLVRILYHTYHHVERILNLDTYVVGIYPLVFELDGFPFLVGSRHLNGQGAQIVVYFVCGIRQEGELLVQILVFCGCGALSCPNGVDPDVSAGPGLVFITLPGVFQSMPLGGLAAVLFFLALLLAAITSAISLMEVVVAFIIEELHRSRMRAVLLSFLLCGVVGVFCSLSFGPLDGFTLFGLSVFDFFDYITSNIMLPIGGLLLAVFAGWKLKRANYLDELTNSGSLKLPHWLALSIYYLVKLVAPLAISLIFLNCILS